MPPRRHRPVGSVATRLEIARGAQVHVPVAKQQGAAMGATDGLRHRVRVGAHSVLSNTGHTEHILGLGADARRQ